MRGAGRRLRPPARATAGRRNNRAQASSAAQDRLRIARGLHREVAVALAPTRRPPPARRARAARAGLVHGHAPHPSRPRCTPPRSPLGPGLLAPARVASWVERAQVVGVGVRDSPGLTAVFPPLSSCASSRTSRLRGKDARGEGGGLGRVHRMALDAAVAQPRRMSRNRPRPWPRVRQSSIVCGRSGAPSDLHRSWGNVSGPAWAAGKARPGGARAHAQIGAGTSFRSASGRGAKSAARSTPARLEHGEASTAGSDLARGWDAGSRHVLQLEACCGPGTGRWPLRGRRLELEAEAHAEPLAQARPHALLIRNRRARGPRAACRRSRRRTAPG